MNDHILPSISPPHFTRKSISRNPKNGVNWRNPRLKLSIKNAPTLCQIWEKTEIFYNPLTLYFTITYLFSACRGVAEGEAGSTQTRISAQL